jgi:hypothetical protein
LVSPPPLSRAERALVFAEVLLAIGAFGGAVGLVSGVLDLHESVDDLPWQSPVIAGIALGALNGLLPAAVAVAAVRHCSWARVGHIGVGLVLMAWILVQVLFIGLNSPLQAVYAAYGATLTVAGSVLRAHGVRAAR